MWLNRKDQDTTQEISWSRAPEPPTHSGGHGEIVATTCLYENDTERRQHSEAIRKLAVDLGIPEEKIRAVYDAFYCSIRKGARIRDYLIILVSRNVRDSVRKGK